MVGHVACVSFHRRNVLLRDCNGTLAHQPQMSFPTAIVLSVIVWACAKVLVALIEAGK